MNSQVGYVLKFYCPIKGKRVRKNAGTRDRREARRVLRECRERLLNGEYAASGGAITSQQTATRTQIHVVAPNLSDPSAMGWEDCYQRYRKHYKSRSRPKSVEDAFSRISIYERIINAERQERGLEETGPIAEYLTLDALEYVQDRLLEGDESKYDVRSPMTVNTTVGAVMSFARYCFRHGWIDRIPPLTKLSVDEAMKGRPISEIEFNEMIGAVPVVVGDRAKESWQFILRIIWESGFRIGDCLDFSWDDERHIHPVWPQQEGKLPTLIVPSTQKNKKTQEIPMMPGLQLLLESTPRESRNGWVINPLPPSNGRKSFKPQRSDLMRLKKLYSNNAIAQTCGVTEAAVRKWFDEASLGNVPNQGGVGRRISEEECDDLRSRAESDPVWIRAGKVHRPTKEWVGRVISRIGKEAGIVVQQEDAEREKRTKYASAHDIRRGFAQRLINVGVSAETLKLVMRHKDFATTEKYYGATREAQSAAAEIHQKLASECKKSELVGGLVGGIEKAPQLSAEELLKLKRLLNSL